MKNKILITGSILLLLSIAACNQNKKNFDASGAFEAEETIISSEASGVIRQLELEEGQVLAAGQVVGYVDSLQLYLKKKQVEAQITALLGKKPDVPVQLAALEEQLKTAEKEKQRIANLVKADAATTKQLDDINAQVELIGRQIASQRSTLTLSSEGISNDAVSLQVQAEQLNDQLRKCSIVNPVKGTVLLKYAEPNEMTVAGKPLYKIADLSSLTLRAYITGNQLPLVKLGQQVKVLTDDGNGGFKESAGSITWISNKSEFTPKTIQTKDERANLVYAIKVRVKNDGALKIGMYAEIKF
jgi:HlyD family secretion protein